MNKMQLNGNGARPEVSFVLISYNQERYIREAVEAAFAQTYSPLEIILSDDCSTDGTFAIMEELAKKYNGPHRVRLNCNHPNLGIGNHINRVMELSSGEYVVIAAGDDISKPERVESLMGTFKKSKDAMAAFSSCIEIDASGKEMDIDPSLPPDGYTELPNMCRNMFHGIHGASAAWHRSVFEVFGPLQSNIVFEDRVIAFRAALLGGICYAPESLMYYRLHAANVVGMFHKNSANAIRKRTVCFRDVYLNNIKDLETFSEKKHMSQSMYNQCKTIMRRRLGEFDGTLKFLSRNPLNKVVGLMQIILNGGNPLFLVKAILRRREWTSQ